ncbi:MAG: hypothetical protein V2I36_12450 [Desulfopila sp.]|jgi:Fe-S-cluster containining protein|nr:hypothetical protein [Desulfopila sp.]
MKISQLPSPSTTVAEGYLKLIQDIEREILRVTAKLPENQLQCRPGCADCCCEFSVFSLEAVLIRDCIQGFFLSRVASPPGCCRFLQNSNCSIYASRPILCRTQGMPTGYVDPESTVVEVSACPENFPEDFLFSKDTLFFMDEFNARLFERNREYCNMAKLCHQSRIQLAEIFFAHEKKAARLL